MKTISLCLIVKNEEDTLGNCLESVQNIVDEIILVDTGSTDLTKEIGRKYTDKIIDFTWIDDFSAARNFAFQQATMDYILWLDADDVLLEEDQMKLQALKNSLDGSVDSYTMIYNYAFDEYDNPILSFRRNRLVKRTNQFQWHGAVHEYIAVNGAIVNSEVAVTHRRIHGHSGRNLAIFEKRLAKGEAFSSRDKYYYARELHDNGYHQRAAEAYEDFLKCPDGWVEDQISACDKLADLYHHLGNEKKELESIFKSFQLDTPRAEFCCRLGVHFLYKNKEYRKATFWFNLATEVKKPKESWGFFREASWTWVPHIQLCICYYYLGEYEKANEHNEIAGKYRPEDKSVLHNRTLLKGLLVDKNLAD